MVSIYADGKLMYSPLLYGEGLVVLNPKHIEELLKTGSLEFVLPQNNPFYNKIQKMKTVIVLMDGKEEIFRGRVLHDTRDFYNRKSVYCEGEMSFLLDSKVRVYDYRGTVENLFRKFVNEHNQQVDEFKRFTPGTVTVQEKNRNVHYANEGYPNTWEELNDKLLNAHGGYLKKRVENGIRYLDYVEEYGKRSSQVIEFGKNLLDLSEYVTAENIITVLIPIGARTKDEEGNDGDPLTIKGINGGKDYIENLNAIELFGRIAGQRNWDKIENPIELKTEGEKYLSEMIKMNITITIKAVDLGLLDVKTEKIRLGDFVRVISKPHEIDEFFICTKIERDLVNPGNTVYTFGNPIRTLTEKQVEEKEQVKKEIREEVEKVSEEIAKSSVKFESKIEQTEQSILLEVKRVEEQADDDFETLSSSISMTANQILLEVSQNYAAKASLALTLDEETKIATLSAEANVISLHGDQLIIDSGNFQIDEDGNVSLEGAVKAKTGEIGGWKITENKMYAGNEEDGVAVIQQPKGGRYVFAAGGTDHGNYGDCPFRVTDRGKLYARQAVIEDSMYMYDEANQKTIKAIYVDGASVCFPNAAYFEKGVIIDNSDLDVRGTIYGDDFIVNTKSIVTALNDLERRVSTLEG